MPEFYLQFSFQKVSTMQNPVFSCSSFFMHTIAWIKQFGDQYSQEHQFMYQSAQLLFAKSCSQAAATFELHFIPGAM